MAITLSNVFSSNDQKIEHISGNLAFAAGSYTTGGVQLLTVLQALADYFTQSAPVRIDIQSAKGSGYTYDYIASSGKVMILQVPAANGSIATAPGPQVELPAAALPAGVTADVIQFHAFLKRNV